MAGRVKLPLPAAPWVATLLALTLGAAAWGERLEIVRPSRLRVGPSSLSARALILHPGDRLTLLNSETTHGYVHVETAGGERGWVYALHTSSVAERPASGSRALGGVSPRSTRHHAPPRQAGSGGRLEVHVINVGQGDAILIRCPEGTHELLIDAGDNRYPGSAAQFQQYLHRAQPRENTLEVVVATHPHADHLGSLDWVLRQFPVALYIDDGVVSSTAVYQAVEDAWSESRAAYGNAQDLPPPDIDFCPLPNVTARLLVPDGFGSESDPNNNSVVVRVDYDDASFLFVGDAEEAEEAQLLRDPGTRPLLDCDFLKVGHHGSDTSSTSAFLDAVSPSIAVVSCGAEAVSTNAKYKHPRLSTVDALLARLGPRSGRGTSLRAFDRQTQRWVTAAIDKALYATVVDGDVVFESDGAHVQRRAEVLP